MDTNNNVPANQNTANTDAADALATGGVLAGAGAASHLMYRKKDMGGKIEAAREHLTEAKEALGARIDELKRPTILGSEKAVKAEAALKAAEANVEATAVVPTMVNENWQRELAALKPKRQVDIQIMARQAQLDYLQGLEPSVEQLHAVRAADAEILAMQTLLKAPEFDKLTASEIPGALQELAAAAREKIGEAPKGFEEFEKKHAVNLAQRSNAVAARYEPKLAKRIARPLEKQMENAAADLHEAENKWQSLFKKDAKSEIREVKGAEEALKGLRKIETANTKTGVYHAIKRPFVVLMEGSNKARLGIVAGAAAVGAITYVGTRMAQELSQSHAPSFQKREQMRAEAAAAAEVPGRA